MELKCLICNEIIFEILPPKNSTGYTYCYSKFCKQYIVKYEVAVDGTSFDALFFDIKYQERLYQIDYIFDDPPLSLYIFCQTTGEVFPLIYPDKLILTPYNFQKKLPILLTYS